MLVGGYLGSRFRCSGSLLGRNGIRCNGWAGGCDGRGVGRSLVVIQRGDWALITARRWSGCLRWPQRAEGMGLGRCLRRLRSCVDPRLSSVLDEGVGEHGCTTSLPGRRRMSRWPTMAVMLGRTSLFPICSCL